MSALIVLGFDVTHVVKTLADYRPRRACVVIGSVDGKIDSRSLNALALLMQVATAMNINVERLDVEVLDFIDAVEKIERKLFDLSSTPPVYVDVGGGLRLLVLETFLAVQRLWRRNRAVNIHLIMYAEGSDKRIEISVNDLEDILLRDIKTELSKLSEIQQKILSILSTEYGMKLTDIHRKLTEQGVEISKQYLATILRRLEEVGIVKRIERGKYIKLITPRSS